MTPTTTVAAAAETATDASVTTPSRSEPAPPDPWTEDLAPIGDADWSYDRARHLLDRAGFGGTPDEIAQLARMTPEAAVRFLVDYQANENGRPEAL